MNHSVAYCEMQLARAKSAHARAAKTGNAAAYERTSDQVGKWEVNLRIARGASEQQAMDSTFGPTRTS